MQYQIGDYVVYGGNGLCTVTDICTSPFDTASDQKYYVLCPYSVNGSAKIFVPLNGEVRAMRRPMSAEEAQTLLDGIAAVDPLLIPSERVRRQTYRQAIATADPIEYIRVLVTITARRSDLAQRGKHLSEADIEYERIAREFLLRELALAFNMARETLESTLPGLLTGRPLPPAAE